MNSATRAEVGHRDHVVLYNFRCTTFDDDVTVTCINCWRNTCTFFNVCLSIGRLNAGKVHMHAGNEMIVHTFYSLSVSFDYTMIVQAGGYTSEPFSWFCYSANVQCYQNISSSIVFRMLASLKCNRLWWLIDCALGRQSSEITSDSPSVIVFLFGVCWHCRPPQTH